MSFEPVVHPNARKVSHVLELTDEELLQQISVSTVIDDMRRKVQAEEQRLSRLLPDPPIGYIWVSDIEWTNDMVNNRILMRVVYRLEVCLGC